MSALNMVHPDRPMIDRDSRCITQYGQNARTNPAEPDEAHNANFARSTIRSRATASYFLHSRARPAPHNQLGQTIESLAQDRVPKVSLKICWFVGQALEPATWGGAHQSNPTNRCLSVQRLEWSPSSQPSIRFGQTRSIICPCSS